MTRYLKYSISEKIFLLTEFETGNKKYINEKDILKECLKVSGDIWCDNLNVEGMILLKYITEKKMRFTEKTNVKDGEFTYLINDEREFFYVILRSNKKRINFKDANKKIKKEKDIYKRIAILKEMENQDMDSFTIGSDCFNDFRRNHLNYKYREIFPILDEDMHSICEEAYKGGIIECFKKGYHDNGTVIDVHSMYSWAMKNFDFPCYKPVWADEIPTYDALYIVRFESEFKLKKGKFPSVQIKGLFGISELIEETYQPTVLTMTKVDYELFKENYDIFYEIIDKVLIFRGKKGIFNSYIDKYYEIKQTEEGERKTWSKLMLNNLSGKFASKTTNTRCMISKNEKNEIVLDLMECAERKPVYIPVAAFITAYARRKLIKTIEEVGFENVIYCDTDSIHLKCDVPDFINLGDRIGDWAIEKKFNKGLYFGKKKYVIDDKIVASGLSESVRTPEAAKKILEGDCIVEDNILVYKDDEFRYEKRFYHFYFENRKTLHRVEGLYV